MSNVPYSRLSERQKKRRRIALQARVRAEIRNEDIAAVQSRRDED